VNEGTVFLGHVCPPDHPHRSGCYNRHKCKCVKCREWVNTLHRNRHAELREGRAVKGDTRNGKYKFTDRQMEIAINVLKGADK